MDMSSEQDRSPELSERNLVLYTGPQCPLRIFISVPALSSSSSWLGRRKGNDKGKHVYLFNKYRNHHEENRRVNTEYSVNTEVILDVGANIAIYIAFAISKLTLKEIVRQDFYIKVFSSF